MYTRGIGSGHVSRINAVYNGFVRLGVPCEFLASVHDTMYRNLLEPGIILCEMNRVTGKVDIFICDWQPDECTSAIPRSFAKCWVGLSRLAKGNVVFPSHYHVIAIEPDVAGDICIWPIINTWPDQLLSRDELRHFLHLNSNDKVALFCENGIHLNHVAAVFTHDLPCEMQLVKCSNNQVAAGLRDINYYPIARFFSAIDYLIIGGGYNSVHEALSYGQLSHTRIVDVGGEDQAMRIQKMSEWEIRRGSRSHELAQHLVELLSNF